MDSCSVKHLTTTNTVTYRPVASYRAQFDDGEEQMWHTHHFTQAGTTQVGGCKW